MDTKTLLDSTSVEEALTKLNLENKKEQLSTTLPDPCEEKVNRTFELKISNTSDWTIDGMLVQLKSTLPIPPGYTSDSGVFLAASGVGPNGSEICDPCTVGGHKNKAIRATYWEYAVKCFIDWNGKRYDRDLYMKCPAPAPAGSYWPKMSLGIKRSATVYNNGLPDFELELVAEEFDSLKL